MRLNLLMLLMIPSLLIAPKLFGSVEKPESILSTHVVKKNSTLYESLITAGFSGAEIHSIVQVAKPHFDLRRLPAGSRIEITRERAPIQAPRRLRLELSMIESLEIHRTGASEWQAQISKKEVSVSTTSYSGQVESSLWESAIQSGMDPQLIVDLAEIFAWQVDFAREVRKGDEWRLSVERKFVEDKHVGWGRITAAEYRNSGELYSAVLFRRNGEDLGYFAPDGNSLKRMFLKSPLKYGRISSHFTNRRFHPVLGVNRPHRGVDYAAPRGTPIRAVGDGVVVVAAIRGGGGKTIQIRHNSIYQTAYKHLSGYAKGIRSGRRVRQGEIIGYVGSTGLSTGPHLHFEFLQSGTHVNPLGKKFPSASPVPKELHAEFLQYRIFAMQDLPPWFRPGVSPIRASVRQIANVSPDDEG